MEFAQITKLNKSENCLLTVVSFDVDLAISIVDFLDYIWSSIYHLGDIVILDITLFFNQSV